MNEEAHIYRNNSNTIYKRNYLRIKFNGSSTNRDGIGASVTVYDQSQKQFTEHYLTRGFESSIDGVMHFGLDSVHVIDSLEVVWPDGKYQVLKNIKTNQLLEVNYKDAGEREQPPKKEKPALFTLIENTGIDYMHEENEFVDFKVQPLLPHMHSKNGPGIAVSDVNGDGLEDFFIGGASRHPGALFLQQADGKFNRSTSVKTENLADDMGILFFDADNDGDDDLYVVTGGSEEIKESTSYFDHLYLNDGKGNFSEAINALPKILQSGSCVIASDYDHDGDLDLFIGGRLIPGQYPLAANSYLLRNDSDGITCKFTDITREIAPDLNAPGMVTAGLWTDVDNDGWTDLLLVGEFMPVTYFRNKEGKSFSKMDSPSLANSSGWWNSLTAGDFDQDGDIDYIAGNLGLNTRYKGSEKEPVCIYTRDYDKNGSIDPVMTYYLQGNKHIVHSRDELISQISVMKLRFNNYKDYATATFDESFLETELEGAHVVCAAWFETAYIENKGNGNFAMKPLPVESQFAPVFGMVAEDFNGDGFLDVLLAGNLYATEVTTGRYDASVGLYVQGNGKGDFKAVSALESGFYADDDAKGMAKLITASGDTRLLIGNNSGAVKTYTVQQNGKQFKVEREDIYALITRKNGKIYKHEFYYGSTYLSQSSIQVLLPDDVTSMEIFSSKGNSRKINFNSNSH